LVEWPDRVEVPCRVSPLLGTFARADLNCPPNG
jgi:hypothetical protein